VQSKLSKVQAARAAGISHTSIWRAIKDGRLSAEQVDGEVRIDASELLRVFPEADLSRADARGTNRSARRSEHAREPSAETKILIDELMADKRRQATELERAAAERSQLLSLLSQKDETIKEKDRQLAQQMETVRLITDQRMKKKSWWRRLW
jgi:hypothetical protein